jgi:signal transduction histidine kinase
MRALRHHFLLILLVCTGCFAPAPQLRAQTSIDSLMLELNAAVDDSSRGAICFRIGRAQYAEHRNEEAMRWYERSYRHRVAAGQIAAAAFTSRVMGGMWLVLDSHLRAMECYERGMRMFEQIGDTLGLIPALWNVGRMHTRKGDFTQSMRYLKRACDLAETVGHRGLMATSLWFIGVEYDFMWDKEEGIKYLRRCLEIREEIGNPGDIEFTLVILAAVCTNGGHYDLARGYLRRSRAIADSLGDQRRIGTNWHSVARIFREEGDLVTAVDYEQRALRCYREAGSLRDIDFTLRQLGTLCSRMGKPDSAMQCFDAALEVSRTLGGRGRLRWHAGTLAEHFARNGEFARAIEWQKRHMALNDSVYNVKTIKRVNELTAAYEAERRERRIALLDATRAVDSLTLMRTGQRLLAEQREVEVREDERTLLAQQRRIEELQLARAADTLSLRTQAIARGRAEADRQRQKIELQQAALSQEQLLRNALAGGLLVALILGVLLLRNLRRRRETAELRTEAAELHAHAVEAQAVEQQAAIAREEHAQRRRFTAHLIASQEKERRRIAGALHDGIGQDLLIIKHRVQMGMADAARRKEHLNDIMEIAVEAVEDVRRLCRDLRPYQLERVGLTETLRGMLLSVDESTPLEVHADIADVDGLIPAEREIDLYRVLQEGMNNIIKHAEASRADVRLQRVNGSLLLHLRDDGKGFDIAAAKNGMPAGMGLEDMTERMHLLGGQLRIESAAGRGTLLEATIPLNGDGIRGGTQESAASQEAYAAPPGSALAEQTLPEEEVRSST